MIIRESRINEVREKLSKIKKSDVYLIYRKI
jgi:hypothetical protein